MPSALHPIERVPVLEYTSAISGRILNDRGMNSAVKGKGMIIMKPGKLRRLIAAPETPALLRGEIWVNRDVLAETGFSEGPEGFVDLASSLGADITFFHWPESVMISDMGGLIGLAREAGLDCGLTIDGPFQRLTVRRNLLGVLHELGGNPSQVRSLLAEETEEIRVILDWAKELEIGLLLITEDLGYTGGLYFSREIFRSILLPFYSELAGQLASTRIALGWHSDGSVEPLLPDLVDCGFRFFSLEPESVDLLNFKRTYGSRAILMSGIRAEWLIGSELNEEQQRACLRDLSALANEGGFILASSCGLYRTKSLPVLKQIYKLAETVMLHQDACPRE